MKDSGPVKLMTMKKSRYVKSHNQNNTVTCHIIRTLAQPHVKANIKVSNVFFFKNVEARNDRKKNAN